MTMKNNTFDRGLAPVLLLGAGLCGALAAPEDSHHRNWPQWRGPSGNGLVARGNPPLEWGESKNIKWKVQIPGKGHATPAIWDNRIFILTAVPDATAGGAAAEAPPPEPPPPAQPAEPEGGRRRGGPGRGRAPTQPQAFTVLCLDRATGKVVWEKVARKEVP